jgi:quercetin dioxygenase-like cupin family protein
VTHSDSLFSSPGTGTAVPIRRFRTLVRVRSEVSGGSAAVLEHTLEQGCIAMPLHRHHAATEVLHVLQGTLTVLVRGELRPAPAGTSVVIPAATWHTFWVTPDEPLPAQFLAIVAPGGLEQYYEEVAAHIPTSGAPDMDAVLATSERHGVEVDMLSLYDLIEQHGLTLA